MSDRAPRILVVDDEENISFLVESALRLVGMQTQCAATGRDAITAATSFQPDLIVLDVMLADLNGFDVLRRLRDSGQLMPVIFLSARDSTDDRVQGLTIGGDDYMVKPFAVAELVARVQLALRRSGMGTGPKTLRCADLELDDDAHRVTRAGQVVKLSATEFKLLRYLLTNTGRVLSRAQILDHVWDYDFGGESSVIETFMSYLRRKVDFVEPKLIHTIRGVGYCLRDEG
ncbi:MAG: response regulator transcription factor [Actinomycetota bacterium]|nr:response regulator [Actinomycetota bacterium]MSX79793.1 response regulator [Actinomycetota bacterium]